MFIFLRSEASAGPDNIIYKFCNISGPVVSEPLSDILSERICKGTFPNFCVCQKQLAFKKDVKVLLQITIDQN